MTETANLGLPLVAAAQAQKHVTVNEAFARIDALTGLTLATIGLTTPPPAPADGSVHVVGAGASGAWDGADGLLALWLNGGWDFITPRLGWQGWSVSGGHVVTFDGVAWVPGVAAFGAAGSALQHETIEIDHAVGSGGTDIVTGALPSGVLILGVSARVLTAVGGVSSLDIGVSGAGDRYAAGMAVASGASIAAIRTTPVAYPAGEDLILTAIGGSFDGSGSLRLAVHTAGLIAPRS